MRLVLTPETVATLTPTPGQKRSLYNDASPDAPPGFGVRVNATRSAFCVRVRVRGLPVKRWVHLGDVRALALDAARELAKTAHHEAAFGRDVNAETRERREAARAVPTVAQLVGMHLDTLRVRRQTELDYRRYLRADIAPSALGSMRCDKVRPADLDAWMRPIAERAPAVADRAMSRVRAAYRWATRQTRPIGRLGDGTWSWISAPSFRRRG